MINHTNRRTILGAIAATPLVAIPAAASNQYQMDEAVGDTRVLALFRQWEAAEERAANVQDEVADAATEVSCEIERQIAAEPSTCITDLAAKIMAVTCDGDFGLSGKIGDAVMAEVRQILAARRQ